MAVKRYFSENEHTYLVMPHSEVMMHMRVAGKRMNCEVRSSSVQLLDHNDRPFSFPVTLGEAGVFSDENGNYVYVNEDDEEGHCVHGRVAEAETCLDCANEVWARFQVRRNRGDVPIAAFDSAKVAAYWIEERDSADYLHVFDKRANAIVKVHGLHCQVCGFQGDVTWQRTDDETWTTDCPDCDLTHAANLS